MKIIKDLKNIFIDVKLQQNDVIYLDKEVTNRLKKVMRFKQGWQFSVFNGKDGLFLAEVLNSEVNEIKLLKKLKNQPLLKKSTLFLPLLKKEALSNAFRQATELGIDIIQPIITQYTIEKDLKLSRYQQIVLGATEQSERLTVPQINEVKTLQEAIKEFDNTIFWACERLENNSKNNSLLTQNSGVLIGPEGGFSDSEKHWLLEQKNIIPKTLGTNILKADTAVVIAIQAKLYCL